MNAEELKAQYALGIISLREIHEDIKLESTPKLIEVMYNILCNASKRGTNMSRHVTGCLFKRNVASNTYTPIWILKQLSKHSCFVVRRNVLHNTHTPISVYKKVYNRHLKRSEYSGHEVSLAKLKLKSLGLIHDD